ncbi:hypothetical protein [Cryobacterium sp. BB307]|uniref:hypothetical protein n=1 Tax=Cryobacterium sp. BB307 TaxID=2716317 RepID=UPI001444C71A|nr:hypothetical protein [Cryobacterium sp. BB307]
MTATLSQKQTSSRPRRIVGIAWAMVSSFFDHVVGRPYREGRLRADGWPKGLKPIATIAVIGYGVAVAGILFSSALRETLPLSVTVGGQYLSFPRPVLWVLMLLLVISIALVQTAVLHVTGWLTAVVTVLTVLVLLFVGSMNIGEETLNSRIATIGVALALIVYTVIRRRFDFAWWDFPAILALLTIAFGTTSLSASALSASLGYDLGPVTVSLMMSTIGQLAVPFAFVAGAAVAQLAATSAVWAVRVVRTQLPSVITLAIGIAALVVWRGWVMTASMLDGDPPKLSHLALAVLLGSLIVVVWLLLARVRGRRDETSVEGIDSSFSAVATPIAAGLAGTLGIVSASLLVAQVAFNYGVPAVPAALSEVVGFLSMSRVVALNRLLVGIFLIVLAIRWARRGRTGTPEILGSIGVVTVMVAANVLPPPFGALWTSEALTIVATVACLALLAFYAAKRALTVTRAAGIAVALLLAALFDQRDFVSDPLGALLGFTGVAFVLFGFVWNLLTTAEYANKGTRRYPLPSRVLIFLAYSLFGVTVLAFAALARDPDAAINLGAFAGVGDQLFGTAIIASALLTVIASVVADRDPAVEPERD